MISYEPLWKTMEQRGITTYALIHKYNINPRTIHNLKHKDSQRDLLTEELVELLTTPLDLAGYKAAITEALYKGTKRNVVSEVDSKNAVVE